jgi:succinate dehydrogenase / fumarate reductase cytochrome b subunit
MSSASPVRHPKGPLDPEPGRGAAPFAWAFFDSSVGAKVTVALTGLGLVLFTIAHMVGNLKVFQGQQAINNYAYFLKHDLGALIWVARAGLLAIFLLHIVLAVRLKMRSTAARPVGYAHYRTARATAASRTMIWSGVVVGLFILFHLAHFTFCWVTTTEVNGKAVSYLQLTDPKEPLYQDVYSMVVRGFTTTWLAALYVVAQLVLFLHLVHGVQSSFQTLGLKNRRFARAIKAFGFLVAFTVLAGTVTIVLGVMAGWAPPLYPSVS